MPDQPGRDTRESIRDCFQFRETQPDGLVRGDFPEPAFCPDIGADRCGPWFDVAAAGNREREKRECPRAGHPGTAPVPVQVCRIFKQPHPLRVLFQLADSPERIEQLRLIREQSCSGKRLGESVTIAAHLQLIAGQEDLPGQTPGLRSIGATVTTMSTVRYSTDHLLTAIPRICREANPDDPAGVSQRQFDKARSRLGIGCPRAARLANRFNTSWKDLIANINHGRGTLQAARRSEQGSQDQVPFDRETAVAAVRSAADALGKDTLLPHEYAEYRAELLDRARGLKRQRLEARWPVVAVIDAVGWEEVLTEAGLARTSATPVIGVDNPDAIGLFLECRGFAPPLRVAIEFLRAHGASARKRMMRTEEALEVLRERRTKEGKWTPPRALRENERPEIPEECLKLESKLLAPHQPARKVRPRGWWMNENRIIEGLKLAINKLEPGESLTQMNPRRVAKGDSRIPSPNSVTEFAKRTGTNLPELRERALTGLESGQRTSGS